MTAEECWRKQLVLPWDPEDEFLKDIRDDLLLSGAATESVFTQPVDENTQALLFRVMAALIHSANTRPGGRNPWASLPEKAKDLLLKKYKINPVDHDGDVLLVGDRRSHLLRMSEYIAATYARSTLRKVQYCSSRRLAEGFRSYTAYESGGWFDTMCHCGLLIVDNDGRDYFGHTKVNGNLTELFRERFRQGRSTMHIIHVMERQYRKAFEAGDIERLSDMIESYVATKDSGNEWILPFIIGPCSYWVLIS